MPLGTREVLIAIRAKDEASRIVGNVSSAFKQSGKDMDEATKAAQAAGKQTMAHGAALMGVGAGVAMVGAVGLAFYADMVKGAIEYNKEASLTLTQVRETGVGLEQIKDIGKDVAKQVAAPFEQMQGALYDIFSSTDLSAKDAKQALIEFSKAAVAGSTDITKASDAGISILNGFQMPMTDLSRVMDAQFKTVQIGRISYEQLASTIGRAIPSAQKAGATVEDLGGMLAFMTRNGQSAAMAATSSARAFDLISNPVFAANMKSYGMATADASGKFLPMTAIVQELQTKMQGMSEIDKAGFLKNITFGAGGTIQAMRFLNEATNDTTGALQSYTDQVKGSAGSMDAAYKIMAETPAYKLQVLKNNWQILRTEIGDNVVPILNNLVTTGTGILNWFEDLSSEQKKAIVYTGLITSALFVLVGAVIAASGAILLMSGAWTVVSGTMIGAKTVTGFNLLTNAIKGFVVSVRAMSVVQWTGLLAVVSLVAEIGAKSIQSMHQYNDFRDSVQKDLKTSNLESLRTAFNKTGAEAQNLINTNHTFANFLNVGHALAAKKAVDDLAKLKEQYTETSTVLTNVKNLTGLSTESVQKLADQYGVDLTNGVSGATTSLADNIKSLQKTNVATQGLNRANAALADTVDGTAEGFKSFKDALDATFGIAVAVDEAHVSLANSTRALKEAYDAARGSTNLNTEAGTNYVAALATQAKNIVETSLAEANAGKISDLSADQKQHIIDKLHDMEKAYPSAKKQIDDYIISVSSIDTQVATIVTADTTQATAALRNLNGLITETSNNLGFMGPVAKRAGPIMGPVAHRAMGGAVEAMRPYLVGENGPELFMARQAGEIMNAYDTKNLLGGNSGGSTMPALGSNSSSVTIGAGAIQIVVQGNSDDVAAQVEAGVLNALRQLSNQVKVGA